MNRLHFAKINESVTGGPITDLVEDTGNVSSVSAYDRRDKGKAALTSQLVHGIWTAHQVFVASITICRRALREFVNLAQQCFGLESLVSVKALDQTFI